LISVWSAGALLILGNNIRIATQNQICHNTLDRTLWTSCQPRVLFENGIFNNAACGFALCIVLDAKNLGMQNLSSQIGRLHNVRRMFLQGNYISQFPENMSLLVALTVIDVSGNPIATNLSWNAKGCYQIPLFIKLIPSLTSLDLSFNSLQDVNVLISSNPLLKRLNLSSNELNSFPFSESENLQFLNVLDLSSNNISSIPDAFLQRTFLTKVTDLNVSENPISDFSFTIHLSNWIMSSYPLTSSFSPLTEVTVLDFTNPERTVDSIPDQFLSIFPNVTRVIIRNQAILSLGAFSSAVSYLDGSSNPSLSSIDEEFCLMSQLETLLLTSLQALGQFSSANRGNGIHYCVHNLRNLKYVNFSSSLYSGVFQYSNSLMPPSLEVLDLSGIGTVFPYDENTSFAKFNRNLTRLRELYMRNVVFGQEFARNMFNLTSDLRLFVERMPDLTVVDFQGCQWSNETDPFKRLGNISKYDWTVVNTNGTDYFQGFNFTCNTHSDFSFTCIRNVSVG
jgi:Leucine-rich repeat (LRR) protein